MSLAAAEDWEATRIIYGFDDDENDDDFSTKTSTTTDNTGGLLRGSIELKFSLNNFVFGRQMRPFDPQMPRYRFWVLRGSSSSSKNLPKPKAAVAAATSAVEEPDCFLRFRLVFWCKTSQQQQDDNNDGSFALYDRLELELLTPYPHSFPKDQKLEWLRWLHQQASVILQEEQITFSVCDFVQHKALDFFPFLDKSLVMFDDDGPLFYDLSTISTTSTVKRLLPLQRHYPNGSKELLHDISSLSRHEQDLIVPMIVHWKSWLPIECPICFDTVSPQQAVIVTCDHGFCRSCLTQYLRIKAGDITSTVSTATTKTTNASGTSIVNNPFVCPIVKCQRGMKVETCVKEFLTGDLFEKVKTWYKDIKNPPSYALDRCLKRDCSGKILRKEAVDSYLITCEVCGGRWCELCLQRAPKAKQTVMVVKKGGQQQEVPVDEHTKTPGLCKAEECLAFCERYLAAGERGRRTCQAKWPWIQHYAKYRVHDDSINDWIKSSGAQVCPGCKTGIERLEGCFHMSCQCGTHFCYECGEEIFYPFYGTHHCWERDQRLQETYEAYEQYYQDGGIRDEGGGGELRLGGW